MIMPRQGLLLHICAKKLHLGLTLILTASWEVEHYALLKDNGN